MENTLNHNLIIKHLANGTLEQNLCIICLMPLKDRYENIFTKVCKEDKEFCIADVLKAFCDIQFSETDNYNVCVECFMTASVAYKFYLLTKRSNDVLNFYTNEIIQNLDKMQLPVDENISICISLPYATIDTSNYDFDLQGIVLQDHALEKDIEKMDRINISATCNKQENLDNDDIVVVVQENGEKLFYKGDGVLVSLNEFDKKTRKRISIPIETSGKQVKKRKKRVPMTHKYCSRCPVKYRFIAKLKEHMKTQHDVDLFVCKLCNAITEDKVEHHNHLRSHTNVHQCAVCNMVFKKRHTIIKHVKWHEKMKNISQTEGAHVCDVCGVVLEDGDSLKKHYEGKHKKKYTCFYCGRMYKGEISFEAHIKKHEEHIKSDNRKITENLTTKVKVEQSESDDKRKKCKCQTCGRYFVDERSLLWHQRLHNNERPYVCETCGRGFVSVNRRNQHALCAHSAPTCRCPLCPALFHMRSMVSTHIKKVHLKTHKRRNHVSKHQNVYWRTKPVPVQELSVSIQNDILELQAARDQEHDWNSSPNHTYMSPQAVKIENLA